MTNANAAIKSRDDHLMSSRLENEMIPPKIVMPRGDCSAIGQFIIATALGNDKVRLSSKTDLPIRVSNQIASG